MGNRIHTASRFGVAAATMALLAGCAHSGSGFVIGDSSATSAQASTQATSEAPSDNPSASSSSFSPATGRAGRGFTPTTPPESSPASNTRKKPPFAVLADTPALKAPFQQALTVGTYRASSHLKLYCYALGQVRTGKRGESNVWFNTQYGSWISESDIDVGWPRPVPSCGSPQTARASARDLSEFVHDNTGKSLTTWAGMSPGQCVSVVENFLDHYYGVVLTGQVDAYTFVSGRLAGRQLSDAHFTWHTDQKFTDGDIVVMDRDSAMPYGHVAMYFHGKLFESNVGGRMTAELDPIHLPNYRGYWRAAG